MNQFPTASEVFGKIDEFRPIHVTEDLRGYAVVNPGKALHSRVQHQVYAALVPITTASFGADMTPYWQQRQKQDYFARLAEFVFIINSADHIVGWTGYSTLRFPAYTNIYIDSSGMVPAHQSHGIMGAVWRSILVDGAFVRESKQTDQLYVSARSESPIIYKMMRKLVRHDRLHPNTLVAVPGDVVDCGRDLAEWLGQTALFEPSALVLRGAYAALDALYGELPSTGDDALDNLFRKQLGSLDAYLLIGQVDGRE